MNKVTNKCYYDALSVVWVVEPYPPVARVFVTSPHVRGVGHTSCYNQQQAARLMIVWSTWLLNRITVLVYPGAMWKLNRSHLYRSCSYCSVHLMSHTFGPERGI